VQLKGQAIFFMAVMEEELSKYGANLALTLTTLLVQVR
jgi:hypothetical protein